MVSNHCRKSVCPCWSHSKSWFCGSITIPSAGILRRILRRNWTNADAISFDRLKTNRLRIKPFNKRLALKRFYRAQSQFCTGRSPHLNPCVKMCSAICKTSTKSKASNGKGIPHWISSSKVIDAANWPFWLGQRVAARRHSCRNILSIWPCKEWTHCGDRLRYAIHD